MTKTNAARKPKAQKITGKSTLKTMSCCLTMKQYRLLKAVWAARSARGECALSEGGIERGYSVSAVLRQLVEENVATLAMELPSAQRSAFRDE